MIPAFCKGVSTGSGSDCVSFLRSRPSRCLRPGRYLSVLSWLRRKTFRFLPDFRKASINQSLGIGFIKKPRVCRFLEGFDELLGLIRHSTSTDQTADDFAFVTGNREF